MGVKCLISVLLFIPVHLFQQKACFNAADGSGPELATLSHLWQFLSL